MFGQEMFLATQLILVRAKGPAFLCLILGLLPMFPSPSLPPAAGVGPKGQEVSVSPGRSTVTALARLEPEGEVIEVGSPMGDRLRRLFVQEGDWKEAGEILAYLESHQELQAQRELAASRLSEAEARLQAEMTYARSLVQEAEIRLRRVEQVAPLEIHAQEATVLGLEVDLAIARKDLERLENLTNRKSAAQQDLDHQTSLVSGLETRYRASQAQLERLQTASDLDRQLANAQLATARAGLARAETASEVRSLQKNLRLAQESLERSVIRAPVSGRILRIRTLPGETTGTRPLLAMGNTKQMFAVAEVYETDIALVRIGQSAAISSPVLSGELTGKVVEIGQMISRNEILDLDPSADTDRRVVRVRIELEQSEEAADFVHLQVTVTIRTG